MINLRDIDWYCDECDSYLNDQPGFDANCGTHVCCNCGEVNYIDEDNILDDDELNDFQDSGCDSYNEYSSQGESYSAYDAALAWISSGMDEDSMFGYSEEELRDAL